MGVLCKFNVFFGCFFYSNDFYMCFGDGDGESIDYCDNEVFLLDVVC